MSSHAPSLASLTFSQVVDTYSSELGDGQEDAESLPAMHNEMCKFYGIDDPCYKILGKELQRLYIDISQHITDEYNEMG